MSKPMKYTSEGVPKNWQGKDWQTYKWAMMNVFKEDDLKDIADGTLTKDMLSTASAEVQERFNKKQIKIMRMIGTSVPPEILQQIRDKETGSEMWAELCNLFKEKQNEAIKAYTIRRLENDRWDKKLASGGYANLHLCKMFSIKSELVGLQHTIKNSTMVDMLLESLPDLTEFECLKSSIRYGADPSVYTPVRVRELILAAAARQKEFRGKRQGKQGGHKGGGDKSGDPEKGGNGNQQNKSSKQRKARLCFVCGSDSHIKAKCPEREEKNSGAGDRETKRKPQGNLTISQENKGGAGSNSEPKRKPQGNLTLSQEGNGLSQILHEPADQGIVTGLITAEAHHEHETLHETLYDAQGTGVDEKLLEVNDQVPVDENFSGWWYFDTASNSHVVGDRSYFVSYTEDASQLRSIRGISPNIAARIAGMGTVALTTEVNGEQTVMCLDDVFYIPGAEFGRFSPGLAHEQGFDFTFNQDTQDFTILWEGKSVAVAKPQEATWGFLGLHPGQTSVKEPVNRRPMVIFTIAEGVGTLALWHERMCHTCPQYLKTMVDRGLVRGMMLTQRHQQICDACHVGKQKKKAHRKKMDRATKWPNQVVYADLLIPSKENRTRYEAVLVVMDGYSRFVRVFLLTSKESSVVNKHLQEYILWAERQAGRNANGTVYKVKQVLTDKGGEFINKGMENWYARRGIEHIRVGPKSSQLNLCERTHQSLVDMMKTTMVHAGFPRSLWPEALRNAVYVKNWVYNRGTQGIPYEMIFGMKPDVHHIRKFGSLAYVHVPVTSGRRKHDNNAKIGFLLGYEEDVVGCKVYFPDEHTARFVSDLRVAEDIVYKDRHEGAVDEKDLESLHFTRRDDQDVDYENSLNHEMATSKTMELVSEPNSELSIGPVGGEVDVAANSELEKGVQLADAVSNALNSRPDEIESTRELGRADLHESDGHNGVSLTDAASSACNLTTSIPGSEIEASSSGNLCVGGKQSESSTQNDGADVESVVGTRGSSLDGNEVDDDDEAGLPTDDDITVASVFSFDEKTISMENNNSSKGVGLEEDPESTDEHQSAVVDNDTAQKTDASVCLDPVVIRETGKRTHRDETQSEEARVEHEAAKPDTKRTRTGLREVQERRRPRRFDDFVMNATTSRVLDENGRPIRACEVKIHRNRREALRSRFANYWMEAEMVEIAALKAKKVIQEIPDEDMPEDAKPVSTMWVYALKSDHQGYVIRFKSRIVALGNHQRPGIDFKETFAPVSRMASFRLLLGLAALLGLEVYGGDVNTAYLNAWLGIRQYLHSINGYMCRVSGHSYVVLKALYGLRQSGREWNSELNDWFIQRGYQRSLTETCLYYLFDGGTMVYVLVYVDDILVATNSKEYKDQLFMDLANMYGLKDQGLLTQYLGVEVTHTPEYIMISQGKYAREILSKLGFENAHAVGNPMEVNSRLTPLGEKESADGSFPCCEAIGMLMYLATSTRPDLAYSLGQLSRFVANPSAKHIGTVKRVLRYLAGTLDYGIKYEKKKNNSKELVLQGYYDSDWANDPDQRKSTTGFVFTLAGGAVAWMSRRQSVIALSTAEAEYIAACEATMEAVAGKNVLQEILPQHDVKLRVGIDSQAAHVMATNPTYSRRTRHIELRWHYVREQVQNGNVELHKVKGVTKPADTFTKPLDKQRLKGLLLIAGIGAEK